MKGEQDTEKLGFATDSVSRPRMVGDLKEAIDSMGLTIYDEETVTQLETFIVNKQGKPVAAANTHDDAVMSLAVAYQLYQTENKIVIDDDEQESSGNLSGLWGN